MKYAPDLIHHFEKLTKAGVISSADLNELSTKRYPLQFIHSLTSKYQKIFDDKIKLQTDDLISKTINSCIHENWINKRYDEIKAEWQAYSGSDCSSLTALEINSLSKAESKKLEQSLMLTDKSCLDEDSYNDQFYFRQDSYYNIDFSYKNYSLAEIEVVASAFMLIDRYYYPIISVVDSNIIATLDDDCIQFESDEEDNYYSNYFPEIENIDYHHEQKPKILSIYKEERCVAETIDNCDKPSLELLNYIQGFIINNPDSILKEFLDSVITQCEIDDICNIKYLHYMNWSDEILFNGLCRINFGTGIEDCFFNDYFMHFYETGEPVGFVFTDNKKDNANICSYFKKGQKLVQNFSKIAKITHEYNDFVPF